MPKFIATEIYESNRNKLTTAVILGHTTACSVKIWARLYKPGKWWLVVSEKPIKGDLERLNEVSVLEYLAATAQVVQHSEALSFEAVSDQTNTFEVAGLSPATIYYYYIIADDTLVPRRTEVGFEGLQTFRTFPENPTELTFGFYSCHDPFSVPGHSEGAWPQFNQLLQHRRADFVIGGGDQVYVDTNRDEDMPDIWRWLRKNKTALVKGFSNADGTLKRDEVTTHFIYIYRQYYRFYWAFPNVLKTYKALPQYMIWDDHEIIDGWGSLTVDERASRLNRLLQDDDAEINKQLVRCLFSAAATVYNEYQHSHNPSTRVVASRLEDSVWDYGFSTGHFAFYALDVRGHHDYARPRNRLLGDSQLERFLNWLDSNESSLASVLFIVSPVPFAHWNESFVNAADVGSSKDDFRDEWGHESNHHERNIVLEKLLKISHERKQIVVILSGDVHSVSAFNLSKPDVWPDARVFNVTSSAISRKPAPSFAELGIMKDSPIDGYAGGYVTKLFHQSGSNNFALVCARMVAGRPNVAIELYRTGGSDGEIVVKTLQL